MNKYHGIRINGRKIDEHRFVAMQIYGEKAIQGKDVHHINGDKSDNRPENLVVISRSEHVKLHIKEMGSKCYFTKKEFIDRQRENGKRLTEYNKERYGKRVGQFSKEGLLISTYRTAREVDFSGFQNPHVVECCNGLRKTHRGFIWKYI